MATFVQLAFASSKILKRFHCHLLLITAIWLAFG